MRPQKKHVSPNFETAPGVALTQRLEDQSRLGSYQDGVNWAQTGKISLFSEVPARPPRGIKACLSGTNACLYNFG